MATKHHKALGFLFTIIILVAGYWIWQGIASLQYNSYQVMVTSPIPGLAEREVVEFNGVVVGRIREIRFQPNQPQKIQVILRIKKGTPITQATIAQFGLSNFHNRLHGGTLFLALRDDGSNTKPIVIKAGEDYPTIPLIKEQTSSDSAQLMRSIQRDSRSRHRRPLQRLTQSISDTTDILSSLLNDDNIDSLQQLMYSMQQVIGMLAENNKELRTILVNTAGASGQLDPLFSSSLQMINVLNSKTLPRMNQLVEHLEHTLNRVDRLTADIQQNPTMFIQGRAPKLGPGETYKRHQR